MRGLEGLAHVAVLLEGHVGAAAVAEVEECLRIFRAPRLAEVPRDKSAHVLGERDPEIGGTRPSTSLILRRKSNLDTSHHDADIIARGTIADDVAQERRATTGVECPDAARRRREPPESRGFSLPRDRRAHPGGPVRIAVCSPQVPFARGGAEILAERLTHELQARGHEADLVTVPFKWYPGERVLTHAFLWRMIDLDEVDGRPVDLVIATKFPSYVIRHPNKVVWLVHQFRQAYDLDRGALGQFDESPHDRALRRQLHELDRVSLGEARKLAAISRNVAERLDKALGLTAEVLLPPPQQLDFRFDGYGDFVLSVNRLDRAKRIDLLIEAVGADPELRCVIAGDGPDRERLEALAGKLGVGARVEFRGRVSTEELADLYARCLAVYYAPVDEDYGMVPYEAFMSAKPVITATDAGGPLDVVFDRRTGLVCEPRSAAIAEACSYLRTHPGEVAAWGEAGRLLAEQVTWDHVVERLLAK